MKDVEEIVKALENTPRLIELNEIRKEEASKECLSFLRKKYQDKFSEKFLEIWNVDLIKNVMSDLGYIEMHDQQGTKYVKL